MRSKVISPHGILRLTSPTIRGISCRGQNPSYRYFSFRFKPSPNNLNQPTKPSTKHHPRVPLRSRVAGPAILITFLLAGGIYWGSTPPSRPATLNDISFVPYTIISREAISPTSFVITIKPQNPNLSPLYLNNESRKWKWPLWSVEFKQPEVQISRHYTPIPPLREEDDDGTLKFYIRAVGDGEMSNYLCRRQVGQEVYLRGPHVGLELGERLGNKDKVVFLAGGTGVVPGMQAAKAVLDMKRDAKVDLLWAVRKREEIQRAAPPPRSSWKFWQEAPPSELSTATESPSPIASLLNEMKSIYGDRLRIRVVVDEEGTRFRPQDLKHALVPASDSAVAVTALSRGCRLHDQKLHERASEFAPLEGTDCECEESAAGAAGKNLFMVSGPDGFIAHYAGEKVWLGGRQTQGPVDGVVKQLQRQNPHLAEDWLVLKL